MGDKSKIEWTDASWNPVTGCTKISPGCDHCYAETIANRFAGTPSYPDGFAVTLRPDRLDLPLRWKRPRRVFVNSMSDLFHPGVPDEYIARVFAVMAQAPQHTFQVLTKRHARMRSLLSSIRFKEQVQAIPDQWPSSWPLQNVWLGLSVENQQWADIRIPALMKTPAAVRFLSCEPLLGPVSLSDWLCCVDWVIVGGESGAHARPMQLDWAMSLRDQCVGAGIPFLFKQWGEWAPTTRIGVEVLDDPREAYGEAVNDGKFSNVTWRRLYRRVGKRAAGRELDGRTWNEYPRQVP